MTANATPSARIAPKPRIKRFFIAFSVLVARSGCSARNRSSPSAPKACHVSPHPSNPDGSQNVRSEYLEGRRNPLELYGFFLDRFPYRVPSVRSQRKIYFGELLLFELTFK